MVAAGTRRDQILDATISVLADHGTKGLTYRAVDTRAQLPAGSTSNHFRTWRSLVVAAVWYTLESGNVYQLGKTASAPRSRAEVVTRVGYIVEQGLDAKRKNALAWATCAVDGGMRIDPEIKEAVTAVQETFTRAFGEMLAGCGSPDPSAHGRLLFCYILALLLNQLADPDPDFDPEGAVRPLIHQLLP